MLFCSGCTIGLSWFGPVVLPVIRSLIWLGYLVVIFYIYLYWAWPQPGIPAVVLLYVHFHFAVVLGKLIIGQRLNNPGAPI
jgi:hypothetical protein